jgi:hypothetical protein
MFDFSATPICPAFGFCLHRVMMMPVVVVVMMIRRGAGGARREQRYDQYGREDSRHDLDSLEDADLRLA